MVIIQFIVIWGLTVVATGIQPAWAPLRECKGLRVEKSSVQGLGLGASWGLMQDSGFRDWVFLTLDPFRVWGHGLLIGPESCDRAG